MKETTWLRNLKLLMTHHYQKRKEVYMSRVIWTFFKGLIYKKSWSSLPLRVVFFHSAWAKWTEQKCCYVLVSFSCSCLLLCVVVVSLKAGLRPLWHEQVIQNIWGIRPQHWTLSGAIFKWLCNVKLWWETHYFTKGWNDLFYYYTELSFIFQKMCYIKFIDIH